MNVRATRATGLQPRSARFRMLGILYGTHPLCTPCVVNVPCCHGTFVAKSSDRSNVESGDLAGDYRDVQVHTSEVSTFCS
jgi:hypothetical protein